MDLETQRLKDMDEAGIATQILSLGGSNNSMQLPGEEGVKLAQDINNELKKAVDAHSGRVRALVEMPLHQSAEAIKELHHCVTELGSVSALTSGSIAAQENSSTVLNKIRIPSSPHLKNWMCS